MNSVEIPERELAVLQRGIQVEEASIAFYSEQRGKAMYAYLIEQEESHRTILQGEYDYLNRTGFWFDFQEFSLEGVG